MTPEELQLFYETFGEDNAIVKFVKDQLNKKNIDTSELSRSKLWYQAEVAAEKNLTFKTNPIITSFDNKVEEVQLMLISSKVPHNYIRKIVWKSMVPWIIIIAMIISIIAYYLWLK